MQGFKAEFKDKDHWNNYIDLDKFEDFLFCRYRFIGIQSEPYFEPRIQISNKDSKRSDDYLTCEQYAKRYVYMCSLITINNTDHLFPMMFTFYAMITHKFFALYSCILRLLGNGWSIPVVEFLLRPLQEIFPQKDYGERYDYVYNWEPYNCV